MNTLVFETSLVTTKLTRTLAYKEAKKDKSQVEHYLNLYKRQIANSIKVTEHFKQRVEQRFDALEADLLANAISRSIRNTSPLSRGADYYVAKTQKYLDTHSNIVVVLERMGMYGAVLVTTYKRGEENLLSDEELKDLRKRGVL